MGYVYLCWMRNKTTTKLFKGKNINIAYKTTKYNRTHMTAKTIINTYNNSSIYQLNRLDCPKKLVVQVVHLRQGLKNTSMPYAIIDQTLDIHKFGNVENTMEIIRKAKKGKFLNSLEKYCIFLISREQIQMNKYNVAYNNTVFETIYQNFSETIYQNFSDR
jgi:hypothetical protein